jgi:hypothetical protein
MHIEKSVSKEEEEEEEEEEEFSDSIDCFGEED